MNARSLFAVAVLLATGCATAPPPAPSPSPLPGLRKPQPVRARTFHYENDTFHGSDDAYTSGVRYSSVATGHVPRWARRAVAHLKPDPYVLSFGWTFGQQFYTPYSITNPERITTDRPYAGWLFAGVIAQAQLDDTSRHTLELDVGLVGPSARGEATQDFIHEYVVKAAPEPEGWRYQVRDTAGGVLRYQYERRIREAKRTWDFDATGHGGVILGNVVTLANAGATVRIGRHLRGFTPGKMTPTVAHISMARGEIPPDTWRRRYFALPTLYVFVRPELRGVADNLFIEGNHPESRNVTARELVHDVDTGIGIGNDSWELTLAIVDRSAEYHGQMFDQSFISAQVTFFSRR